MVAVGFVAVSGALGPAHREPGDAQGRHVGEIMQGVIQQRDAAPGDSAKNFRNDKSECRSHGPAEHGGTEYRMRAASVHVARLRAMVMAVPPYYFTCSHNGRW